MEVSTYCHALDIGYQGIQNCCGLQSAYEAYYLVLVRELAVRGGYHSGQSACQEACLVLKHPETEMTLEFLPSVKSISVSKIRNF